MKELANEKVCLALGYFDSVHLGHRKLIDVTRKTAAEHGIGCAVSTFSNNAYKVFNSDGKQVYTYAERCELLSELCDYILPMRFDAHLKSKTASEFLDMLFAKHNIAAVVCGYDYLFGAGASGDSDFLREYCSEHGTDCVVVDKFELDGVRVSTSLVKELLSCGEMEKANEYLGSPFSVSGKVVHGRGAGRMFDIPTANLKISMAKLLPAAGVYGTSCVINGETYYGATNVGARPTFGITKQAVETMISDFDDNIYDADMTVYFHKRLRGVKKFETPAELSKQIHVDIRWNK